MAITFLIASLFNVQCVGILAENRMAAENGVKDEDDDILKGKLYAVPIIKILDKWNQNLD